MQIEFSAILVAGAVVMAALAALFIFFWVQDRPSRWLPWLSLPYLFNMVQIVLPLGTTLLPAPWAAATQTACVIAAFSFSWQGARAFERRPSRLWVVIAVPAVWFLAAAQAPVLVDHLPLRVALVSLFSTLFLGLTAWELYRGRSEMLPSRWPMIVLLISLAAVFAIRMPLANIAPYPAGGLPPDPAWVSGYALAVFAHQLLLTVLMVSLIRERGAREQRLDAQTDPLTGSLNRRAFTLQGARLVQRSEHDRRPISLLLLDLDRFKSINDRFGHGVGDRVLALFSDVAHAGLRAADSFYRIGGEEFCCLLPSTTAEQAMLVAERLRTGFARAACDVGGATVSVGISSALLSGYDVQSLVRDADMALLDAKRGGRNRCVYAAARVFGADPLPRGEDLEPESLAPGIRQA